ncbi:hypothetical protein GCM10010168_23240 [Actinoplanes ianthinogenes]|uniref:Uncharacterized protein n=1 Tax=Actinoplanes ianthinogenes TaxID=122358 RepID=A0ABM7M8L5_9ACTN|nr:hypothetical protein [Actinoplanes ianthinogenes]BCJ47965.1 hypothetical protein Aiant_86220 [Actinoplanes ianthinogenes]GGR05409.1 hypothetical protein GCM10010168_23240 [Actinoplanes ianthinogenes]
MFVFDAASEPGRRRFAGPVVLAVVLLIGVALWRFPPAGVTAPDPSPPAPPPPGDTFRCGSVYLGDDAVQRAKDDETCRRLSADYFRRSPRTNQDAVDPRAVDISRAVLVVACADQVSSGCPYRERPARPDDVTKISGVLRGMGYPEATVRLARPADPAAEGTVIIGVPVDGLCYVAGIRMGFPPQAVPLSGLLPDGRCLDR